MLRGESLRPIDVQVAGDLVDLVLHQVERRDLDERIEWPGRVGPTSRPCHGWGRNWKTGAARRASWPSPTRYTELSEAVVDPRRRAAHRRRRARPGVVRGNLPGAGAPGGVGEAALPFARIDAECAVAVGCRHRGLPRRSNPRARSWRSSNFAAVVTDVVAARTRTPAPSHRRTPAPLHPCTPAPDRHALARLISSRR